MPQAFLIRPRITMDSIHHELAQLKERNRKVEADKAWETSLSRKVIVALLTYGVTLSVFILADVPQPFLNALIPTVAFFLSTLSLTIFKKLWLRYIYTNKPRPPV